MQDLPDILGQSFDAVICFGDEGKVIAWNAAAERLFAIPADKALGQTLDGLRGEPRFSSIFSPAHSAFGGESIQAMECVLTRADQSIAVVEINANRLRDGGVALIARDITATREAEEALRKSELRFQFLNDLGEQTREISDPKLIMARVARLLGQNLHVSRCAYADVEADSDRFTIQQDYTDGCASTVGDYHLSLFGPRAVSGLLAGETLVIRDVDAELAPGDGAEMFNAIGIKAIVCCPLAKDGRLRAMMAVHQATPRDWARWEIALVEEVVERCWAIIERARADAILRVSETLKSAILDTSLDGFILMNHEGRILDWNKASERIFGRARDEVIGQMLADTILPERLREEHLRDLARYAIQRDEQLPGDRYELPALRSDGSEFPSEISISHIPGTEPPLFARFVRDITERKEAEAKLVAATAAAETAAHAIAESTERFRLLAEVVSLQAWTAQVNGDLDYANQECMEYFGAESGAEVLGNAWAQFVHPDDLPNALAQWQVSLASGENYEVEFRLRRYDGEYRWFIVRAQAMLDNEGAITRWFGSNTDIHDLKTAQSDAEHASRAKDAFLAALSHELRTPLTPVLMMAAALRADERLPEDAREQLGMMERNIALEARLIDDLLDLTRIARGQLHLRSELCDTHSLIGLAVEIVRDDALAKGITVERKLRAQNSGLVVDPARFQQVIWNLLRNAVKFTPRGGRVMILTSDDCDDDGVCYLRIEVADSGIGIDPAVLEKIFLPFEQGHPTGDHRFGGMGLGLAIARAIVDLHGGTITAESEGPDRGATFMVELPGATDAPQGATDLPSLFSAPAAASLAVPIHEEQPLRLLLVEDHESTLEVLSRLLTRAGHQVVSAGTLTDALAAANGNTFDLVISDLGLPDGTGNELMEILRARYSLRGIALSGYGMEEDVARARQAGFAAHLTKPVDFRQLQRVLDDVMNGDALA